MYSNTSQMKTWWWRFTWCFIRYQGSSIVPKWTSSIGFWLQELFMSLIASSAGVFFERPRICLRNFPKRGGDGASQRERGGGGKREEIFFLPSPSPLSFFRPGTYRKGLLILFLLSPIFHYHEIKDGGYHNILNTNKVSPNQNTPAQLQAMSLRAC